MLSPYWKLVGLATVLTLLSVLGAVLTTDVAPTDDVLTRLPIESVQRRIFATGRVEGKTDEVDLRPDVQGVVTEVAVVPGQWVKKGQLLLQLDDRQYRHEYELAVDRWRLAEAELEHLQNSPTPFEREEVAALYRAKAAELELVQLTWNRFRRLLVDNAVSAQEVDDQYGLLMKSTAEAAAAKARWEHVQTLPRKEEIDIAQAKIAAARSGVKLAKVWLDRTSLHAPTDGSVLEVHCEPGEIAGSATLEPPIVFANTSVTRVRAFVEELDALRVHVGQPAVVVADGLPGREFRGHVTRLSPSMGPKTMWNDKPNDRRDTKTREIWIDLVEPNNELVFALRVDVYIDATHDAPEPAQDIRGEIGGF